MGPLFVHRPLVMTRRGLVVAGHHLAAEAGARILREGGNAMDAAVAAAATLVVAIPHMNGLGGDAFALWFDRKSGKVTCINGSGGAPARATVAHYRSVGLDRVPRRGPLSISVPGAVRAWATALERFGTASLKMVLLPAIDLAETGVPVDRHLRDFLGGPLYAELSTQFPALAALYGPPGGRRLGGFLPQPALARTLRQIADKGAGTVYGGDIGRALAADAARAGSLLTLEDLARHVTGLQPPLSIPYLGAQVFVAPPNSQGLALLLLLGMLDAGRDGSSRHPGEFLLRFVELKGLAFHLRDRHVGDPGLARIPEDLLAPTGLAELARAARKAFPRIAGDGQRSAAGGGDTTCVVAMDKAGNAASWVQSLFEEFGSGVASESTGIVLHNRLHLAGLREGHPNTLAPGRRPFHTLCPALVLEGGRCRLAIATPGDHGQPQTLAQVIVNLWERGMDIQEAIEAPRVRHDRGLEVLAEDRLDPTALAGLTGSGYEVQNVGPWSRLMGGVNAIYSLDGTLKMGGADPRRASYAVAQ